MCDVCSQSYERFMGGSGSNQSTLQGSQSRMYEVKNAQNNYNNNVRRGYVNN